MLDVHRLILPRFLSNTYLVRHPVAAEAIVIDPGDADTGPVEGLAAGLGVSVPYVILTHEHFDHVAGANRLRDRLGSRLVCSAACAARAQTPQGNMSRYWGGGDIIAGPPDITCDALNWTLDWGGVTIGMLSTPGHTPGGICLTIENCLFSGDTLLDNVRTPTNLPESSAQSLRQSVADLMRTLPPDTLVYPGHGNSFPLGTVNVDTVFGKDPQCRSNA